MKGYTSVIALSAIAILVNACGLETKKYPKNTKLDAGKVSAPSMDIPKSSSDLADELRLQLEILKKDGQKKDAEIKTLKTEQEKLQADIKALKLIGPELGPVIPEPKKELVDEKKATEGAKAESKTSEECSVAHDSQPGLREAAEIAREIKEAPVSQGPNPGEEKKESGLREETHKDLIFLDPTIGVNFANKSGSSNSGSFEEVETIRDPVSVDVKEISTTQPE